MPEPTRRADTGIGRRARPLRPICAYLTAIVLAPPDRRLQRPGTAASRPTDARGIDYKRLPRRVVASPAAGARFVRQHPTDRELAWPSPPPNRYRSKAGPSAANSVARPSFWRDEPRFTAPWRHSSTLSGPVHRLGVTFARLVATSTGFYRPPRVVPPHQRLERAGARATDACLTPGV
jgi:hypothetical protein